MFTPLLVQAHTLNACLSITDRPIQTTFMEAEQLGGIKEAIPEDRQKRIRSFNITITVSETLRSTFSHVVPQLLIC